MLTIWLMFVTVASGSPGLGESEQDEQITPPNEPTARTEQEVRGIDFTDRSVRRRLLLAWQMVSSNSTRRNPSPDRDLFHRTHESQSLSMVTAWAMEQQQQRLRIAAAYVFADMPIPRTVIPRVHWSQSTIHHYMHGTASVFRANFRFTKRSFGVLMGLIRHRMTSATGVSAKYRSQSQAQLRRHPSPEFRVCVCLYILAHGGRIKPVADGIGQGLSTVRRWLEHLFLAVIDHVRPVYMSGEPPSPALVARIRGSFGARRGIGEVCMAVNGSHIPFNPPEAAHCLDYKNYKGWTSILAVAFVNSQHLFVDLHVGATGRSGNNTVLRTWDFVNRLQSNREVWLGADGLVAADGGASDARETSGVFLNPYFQPSTARADWFNFCHSSTRFFVEEVFGRWKNRWRCLLRPTDLDHRMTSLEIYVTAILHNMLTVEHRLEDRDGDEAEGFVGTDAGWQEFFEAFESERCPSCVRRQAAHCVHMARFRTAGVGSDSAYEARVWQHARRAPCEQREEIADRLLEFMEEEWGGDEFTLDTRARGHGRPDGDGRPGTSSNP